MAGLLGWVLLLVLVHLLLAGLDVLGREPPRGLQLL